jgi:hypothetical protein
MTAMNIKSEGNEVPSPDYDCSPTIWLNDDQCEALGITSPPAPGKVYHMKVVAVATSVTAELEEADEASTEGSAPDVRLTLKLTDIEIVDSRKSIAASLYGE